MSDFDPTTPQPMMGDTQPQPAPASASNDAPPPAFGVGDVPPALPPAPSTGGDSNGGRFNRVLLTIAGVLLAVIVVLATTLIVMARNNAAASMTPSQILDHAKQVHLTDATYGFQGQLSLNLGSLLGGASGAGANSNTGFALTGNGKFTANPARNDISVSAALFGSQTTLEVLTDGSTAYLKGLDSLFGASGSGKWVKVSLGSASVSATDFASAYDHLQNATLIGTETINGHQTWHLRGTLDLSGATSASPGASATATAVAKQFGLSSTSTATEDVWIEQNTYYPVRIAIDANLSVSFALPAGGIPGLPTATPKPGAAPSATATATPTNLGVAINATATFSAWNSGVTITPPSPSQVTTLPTSAQGIPGLSASSH